jgi:predicted RNase H-like HicB family nuclease
MNRRNEKDLAYYLNLKYPVQVHEQEESGYFVSVPDLPGCMTQGETLEEAMDNIGEAKELWLEEAYESNIEIPLPDEEREFSGKFVVRLPAALHRQLARQAEEQGTSLNQFVAVVLAQGAVTHALDVRLSKTLSAADRLRDDLEEIMLSDRRDMG